MADYSKLKKAENISLEKPNTYADQIAEAVENTGKPYQYDFNADQLYQDYKKNYMTEAMKARANVINSGKQLTGAAPDTYVDSSANQQYQTYMAEINRLAPTFENLAYQRHLQEENDAMAKAQMLGKLDAEEYARYRDQLGDLRNYRNYELGNYKYDVGFENEQNALANKADTANKEYFQKLFKDRISKVAAERAAAARGGGGGGGRGGYGYGGGGDGGTEGSGEYIANATGNAYKGGASMDGFNSWIHVAGMSGRYTLAEVNNMVQSGAVNEYVNGDGGHRYEATTQTKQLEKYNNTWKKYQNYKNTINNNIAAKYFGIKKQ